MEAPLKTLLSLSSSEMVYQKPNYKDLRTYLVPWKDRGKELGELLTARNGFWAYESSLLIRPFSNPKPVLGLIEWNDPSLWKKNYESGLERVLFFAEDVFGGQFCISDNAINYFEPETGDFEFMAGSLGDWAKVVMDDFEFRTGQPLSREWQLANRPLEPGLRLLPKRPFVLGGQFELANLYSIEDVDGMNFRASLAKQIRDVPDGNYVSLEVTNRPTDS